MRKRGTVVSFIVLGIVFLVFISLMLLMFVPVRESPILGAILFENKPQIENDNYNSFGQLYWFNKKLIFITRDASTHHLQGRIVKYIFDDRGDQWVNDGEVYDSEWDDRGGRGGIIKNKLYLFISRRDGSRTHDMGYVVSEDGGNKFSDFKKVELKLKYQTYLPFGHIVETNVKGKYYMPFYAYSNGWYLKLLESKDYGKTWDVGPTIYADPAPFAEPAVEHIGEGKMIALIRKEDHSGGVVKQSMSSDNGETWSKIVDTNLGEGFGKKISYVYYDKDIDKIFAIYMDRRQNEIPDDQLKISISDPQKVFDNPMAWETTEILDNNYFSNCCGYPSIVKLEEGKYYFMHSKEVDKEDADTWGGYLTYS